MKKILFLGLLSLLVINNLPAQETDQRTQSVYFEVLGPGATYSVNYDTRFQKTNDGLGGRIGVSYFAVDGASLFSLPVQLNYLLGKNSNYFEVGAGATFLSLSDRNDDDDFLFLKGNGVFGSMTFGYRRQPVDGGFSFRGGFSPVFGNGSFIPYWPYVSFGYSF